MEIPKPLTGVAKLPPELEPPPPYSSVVNSGTVIYTHGHLPYPEVAQVHRQNGFENSNRLQYPGTTHPTAYHNVDFITVEVSPTGSERIPGFPLHGSSSNATRQNTLITIGWICFVLISLFLVFRMTIKLH